MKGSEGGTNQEQAMEALQSLGDFHQGKWNGQATSFSVTADIAAGIVQKKKSPPFTVDVKISPSPGDLVMNEMYSWQSNDDTESAPRSLSIMESSFDCDAVDSSYSLHSYNQPDFLLSMADLIGTEKEIHFSVEHAIAASDDARVRLLVLYGENEELIRVVVLDETRVPETTEQSSFSDGMSLTATDLLELQSDVDRLVDKIAGQVPGATPEPTSSSTSDAPTISPKEQEDPLQRLKESLAKQQGGPQQPKSSKPENDGTPLSRRPMSLLELTSGVWLGDSIIRDFRLSTSSSNGSRGKGFGSSKSTSSQPSSSTPAAFGNWVVGVQKVAREWLWDFGEQIRQNNDAGKCLGVEMEPALAVSMGGSVCENQSLSRRIPKEERMVYIDWNDGNGDNHVGFLLGSVSIQVPRFASFGSPQSKPFYTELCVYQSAAEEDTASSGVSGLDATMEEPELPAVVCSRICRLYNTEGQLKQGCTSFYSLRRFDSEG